MLMHAGKTVEYWAYGGDFGSFPDDAQFCINGMIWPNREPHPGCFEAKAAMVTCTHTPHCPPYHLVLSTFSSAHVGFRWSPSIWSCSALTSCIQLICQIALIAACSHDDVLLLAWRYLASAQTEGSILVIATHMRQPVHCVLAAAVFREQLHARLPFNNVSQSTPPRSATVPNKALAWTPTLLQCGFYCSYSLLLLGDHYTLYG